MATLQAEVELQTQSNVHQQIQPQTQQIQTQSMMNDQQVISQQIPQQQIQYVYVQQYVPQQQQVTSMQNNAYPGGPSGAQVKIMRDKRKGGMGETCYIRDYNWPGMTCVVTLCYIYVLLLCFLVFTLASPLQVNTFVKDNGNVICTDRDQFDVNYWLDILFQGNYPTTYTVKEEMARFGEKTFYDLSFIVLGYTIFALILVRILVCLRIKHLYLTNDVMKQSPWLCINYLCKITGILVAIMIGIWFYWQYHLWELAHAWSIIGRAIECDNDSQRGKDMIKTAQKNMTNYTIVISLAFVLGLSVIILWCAACKGKGICHNNDYCPSKKDERYYNINEFGHKIQEGGPSPPNDPNAANVHSMQQNNIV